MIQRIAALLLAMGLCPSVGAQENNQPPAGFQALFDSADLTGWHGEATMSPAALGALPDSERTAKLKEWQQDAIQHWSVADGELVNDGEGVYLTSDQHFGDVELWIDYQQIPGGDSGIYLRATPQVQIWDPTASSRNAVGSGGLFNNEIHPSKPLVAADKRVGEWNRFRILQVGSRNSVWLNGKLVVDHAIMENYWYPGSGDTAYVGMCELQVLDDEHEKWRGLDARQYHGSAYGIVAAHRGYLRPTGEWNFQEVTVRGSTIQVELNGTEILNTDISQVTEFLADHPHPGKDRTSGSFGFAGHSDPVQFRNVSIKRLQK